MFTPPPKAPQRVLEFLAVQINIDNTRKAYFNAARRFADWCDKRGFGQLADVKPSRGRFHEVAAG